MPERQNKLVCICGMCGSGKSVVADEFVKAGYEFIRFGQITLDICKEAGVSGEAAEKEIREGFRKEHGPEVFAVLNIPKFDKALEKGNVVGDGLYSWSEYKVLKERYGDRFKVIAIWAPPELRYQRISTRVSGKEDKALRNRSFTKEEALVRDYNEIENIEKAGPIAMADHMLLNIETKQDLIDNAKKLIKQLDG